MQEVGTKGNGTFALYQIRYTNNDEIKRQKETTNNDELEEDIIAFKEDMHREKLRDFHAKVGVEPKGNADQLVADVVGMGLSK